MSDEKYSLVEYDKTKEYHLYESYKKPDGNCYLKDSPPLCGDKAVTPDVNSNLFACLDEKKTRTKCAELANEGKDICGRCVGSLYATQD